MKKVEVITARDHWDLKNAINEFISKDANWYLISTNVVSSSIHDTWYAWLEYDKNR